MAISTFNINEAFTEVFGVYARTPLFVPLPSRRDGNPHPEFPEAQVLTDGPDNIPGRMVPGSGQLVIDTFRFEKPESAGAREYTLPHEVILEPSRAKHIIKTQLQGINGQVKEYIAMDDWMLVFRGFLINHDQDRYPEDAIEDLYSFFEYNKRVTVYSEMLSRLGVFHAVTSSLRLPPMEGFQNVQPFQLEMISDDLEEADILLL